MTTNGLNRSFLTLCLLPLLAVCACSTPLTIDQIHATPGRYNERPVTVAGTVTQTFALPIFGQSLVRIDDGTGPGSARRSGELRAGSVFLPWSS